MGSAFPCRAGPFADDRMNGRCAVAEQQIGAIEEQGVVARRQAGELQARRTARGLRRDEHQPAARAYRPFRHPLRAVAKLVGVKIPVVHDIGFVAGRV